ncbi:DUF502 domain-containing protein [Halalkalicoccus ordinarius]|uniref:DUF502 domain-containing protein n=1 Tax=Halalkalicoccus ordinarius TaxID=3116651 RepID=UPI00300F6E92
MADDSRSTLWRWLIEGIAITIPLVITLMILLFVLDFILGMLSPVVGAVEFLWPGSSPPAVLIQLSTLASLIGLFLFVGFVADRTSGSSIASAFHSRMEALPVLGSLYMSVRQASDVLFDDENEQFRDVKLVEFPHQDAYMLGFLTAETPPEIREGVGADEMQTIMIPLGPNPTSNGFIMHFPTDRVHDVDLTVEDAFHAIATLGVAADPDE